MTARSRSERARRTGAALAALALAATSSAAGAFQDPAPASPEDARRASHRRMLAELEAVARASDLANEYLSPAPVEQLRSQLAALEDPRLVEARWRVLLTLGQYELRLGEEEAALEHLREACGLLPRVQVDETSGQVALFQLGVACMRLGETRNCCARNTPESCILPLRGGALHTDREGSTEAIRVFTELLARERVDPYLASASRWLLNVAYMTLGRYPDDVPEALRMPAAAFASEVEFPRLVNRAAELGLDTFSMCGGAIADDFDGDEYLDLVVSNWDTRGQLRFFRNQRDGSFVERTAEAGLTGITGGLNLLQADYDGDGWTDVLVLRGAWFGRLGEHPNSLLRNDGDGTFTDVTFAVGLGAEHFPTQTASWADYDNDGDLDLYVGNEHSPELRAPCQLFRNEGDGTFVEIAKSAGVENLGYTKGVIWGDYDGDRLPDLYVSNLTGPNRLYRNRGDGTFVDVAPVLDVARPYRSFPTWFWDFDQDGHLDLFVGSYTGHVGALADFYLGRPATVEPGRLYRGDGEGGFEDVTERAGLTLPMLPMGSNFGDLDCDGYPDFYLGTGDPDYASLMPNMLFWNRSGERFSDVTLPSGLGHLQKGHGVAFADLDNDGDTDVFEEMGGAFPGDKYGDALYENPGFGNHWLSVRLVGTRSNRSGVGARIRAEVSAGETRRTVYRHVNSGGSFGCNPLRQTLGLGAAGRVDTLEVYWPSSDTTQRFHDVPADQAIRIVEGEERWTPIPLERLSLRAPAER